jgi:hypothetical protein
MKLQFSLTQLFVCVTLLAVGGSIAWVQFRQRSDFNSARIYLLWYFGGALIGAGIGQLH